MPGALIVAASLLTGCFVSHERGLDSPPPPPPSPGTDASSPPPIVDAGPIAAPPTDCAEGLRPAFPVDPELLCGFTIEGRFAAGLAQPFEAILEGCYCGGEISCDTRVVGPRALRVDTLFCENPDIDCDCFEETTIHRIRCDVPPLEAGQWSVAVDGRPAFLIDVQDVPIPPDRFATSDVCWVTAPREDPPETACRWPSDEAPTMQLCHEQEVLAGEYIDVAVSGPNSCEDDRADCEVTVVGDQIRVEPRLRTCREPCPTCELCAPVAIRCTLPPLTSGTYEVVSGALSSRLFVLEGGTPRPGATCSSD